MRRIGLPQRIFLGFLALSLSILLVVGVSLQGALAVLDSKKHQRGYKYFIKDGTQLEGDLLKLVQTQEIFDQYLGEQTWRNYFEFSSRLETLLARAKETPTFRRRGKELQDLDHSRIEMAGLLANATFTQNPNFSIGAVSPASLKMIKKSRSQIHDQIRQVLVGERDARKQLDVLMRQQLITLRERMILVVWMVLAGGLLFAGYLHRTAMDPLRRLMEVIRSPDETGIPAVLTPVGSSEMRDLIDSFNQLNLALRRHQKRQSSMLSWSVMVAHEVRNPLAAIATAIQVLEAGFPKEHPERPVFGEVLKEVFRVNAIISDLLEFSKPRPLELESARWTDLIGELRVLLSSTLAERRIRMEPAIGPGVDELPIDRMQLHRALLNLLNNAIDAIGSDGEISFQVEARALGGVLLVVEDSGPGIPPLDRERVFDPFFSRKSKGTGLGLAIVAGIVERHLGQIRALPGKVLSGARFEIELPTRMDSSDIADEGEPGRIAANIVQETEHDRSSFG